MADQNKNLTSEEAEALEAQSSPDNMVFLTGDKHGDMGEVKKFCKRMELPQDSTVITAAVKPLPLGMGIQHWLLTALLS